MPTRSMLSAGILILISCFYAGLTSNILFGIRGYDILIILLAFIVTYKFMRISHRDITIIMVMFLLTITSTFMGFGNEFYMSGLREWLIIILTFYVATSSSKIIRIKDVEWAFRLSIILLLLIYVAILFYKPLYYYYASVDHLESMSDQAGRIHGPSPILVTYLFLALMLLKVNIIKNIIYYSIFTVLIFYFTQGRQLLAIMGGSLILSLLLMGYFRLLLTLACISIPPIISWLLTSDSQMSARMVMMFDPFGDSSFIYRVISNTEFINDFLELSWPKILFGLGFGSTFTIYMGDYIGYVDLVILDNSILTLIMRMGFIGLLLYYFCYFYISKDLSKWQKIISWFPIIIASVLSAHIVTIPLYIFGFTFLTTITLREKLLT